MYTCTYCVPFLKHVPFWNMFHFGIVCRSEKCTILKHISDWQCANFVIMVISKPSVKCKVLKHKTCAKRPWRDQTAKLLQLFVCFSVMNVGLLQIQWFQKAYCLPSIWLSLQCQSETYFSELHTMPIWNMFQNDTPHVSERHAAHALRYTSVKDSLVLVQHRCCAESNNVA